VIPSLQILGGTEEKYNRIRVEGRHFRLSRSLFCVSNRLHTWYLTAGNRINEAGDQ